MNDEIPTKLAITYQLLTLYWMGKRSVIGYQTVEYIGDQAYHCARQSAKFSQLAENQA
jgi:hypothetical protein